MALPASATSFAHLLASGQVRWGSSARTLRTPADPVWTLAALGGRVVELIGVGATAPLTVATLLVREAQTVREPVAWVTRPDATFFPPDVAGNGVDLEALVVVRGASDADLLRAADRLLRSGAFGLVVLDGRLDLSLAAEVRLANLAQAHDAVLLCLTRDAARLSSASLRAASACRRLGAGRFASVLTVCKDKRRGGEWQHLQECDGPLGLR